jgi:hypothetical protein
MFIFNKSNKSQKIAILGLAVSGLLLAPNSAQAFTVKTLSNFTDDDFERMISTGEYTEDFVAQSQIGNNARTGQNGLDGDKELQLFDVQYQSTTSAPNLVRTLPISGDAQFDFDSNELEDFSLSVKGSTLTYEVGKGEEKKTIEKNIVSGSVEDLFLRLRTQNYITKSTKNAKGETVTTKITTKDNGLTLSNLTLNNVAINPFSLTSNQNATTDANVNYLLITGLKGDFTLKGKSAFKFELGGMDDTVRGARLAYQIKGGSLKSGSKWKEDSKSVPEPSLLGAIFLSGVAGYASRKGKKLNNAN